MRNESSQQDTKNAMAEDQETHKKRDGQLVTRTSKVDEVKNRNNDNADLERLYGENIENKKNDDDRNQKEESKVRRGELNASIKTPNKGFSRTSSVIDTYSYSNKDYNNSELHGPTMPYTASRDEIQHQFHYSSNMYLRGAHAAAHPPQLSDRDLYYYYSYYNHYSGYYPQLPPPLAQQPPTSISQQQSSDYCGSRNRGTAGTETFPFKLYRLLDTVENEGLTMVCFALNNRQYIDF